MQPSPGATPILAGPQPTFRRHHPRRSSCRHSGVFTPVNSTSAPPDAPGRNKNSPTRTPVCVGLQLTMILSWPSNPVRLAPSVSLPTRRSPFFHTSRHPVRSNLSLPTLELFAVAIFLFLPTSSVVGSRCTPFQTPTHLHAESSTPSAPSSLAEQALPSSFGPTVARSSRRMSTYLSCENGTSLTAGLLLIIPSLTVMRKLPWNQWKNSLQVPLTWTSLGKASSSSVMLPLLEAHPLLRWSLTGPLVTSSLLIVVRLRLRGRRLPEFSKNAHSAPESFVHSITTAPHAHFPPFTSVITSSFSITIPNAGKLRKSSRKLAHSGTIW